MKKLTVVIFSLSFISFLIHAQDALTVDPSGNVGIGTDVPSAKLEVKGRIKDQTGYLVPVGSTQAYFGTKDPAGWLICDGRSLSSAVYPDLYTVLGIRFGDGSTDGGGNPASGDFNLPDLRGQFLRGVDPRPDSDTSRVDPDNQTRVAQDGVTVLGPVVGSYQKDAFQGHWHDLWWGNVGTGGTHPYSYRNNAGTGQPTSDAVSDGINGTPRTTHETRPKNVYVNFIIKY